MTTLNRRAVASVPVDLIDQLAHRNMSIYVLASGVACQLDDTDHSDLREAIEQIRDEALRIHYLAHTLLSSDTAEL